MLGDAQRLTAGLAVAMAVALAASPVSSAHPNRDSPSTASAGLAVATAPPRAPTIVRVTDAPSRFDWGDAAIGVGGGIAFSMIAVGATVAISQHRSHDASELTTHTRRI